ncbi:alpha/beta fold hydrolase [Streptomyces sp. NPDC005574]|uniref:RBBP9/YdeN family alpha/beta hydrolase n=1 Tax=Streptomyces sp. NPDC005574 TaxID=3156891 RepID=UPI0033ABE7AA
MWNRSFLILHGVENHRPAEHWQYDLAQRLREGGEQVFYPQLPNPDRPALAAWTAAIEAELDMMRGERVVVCHSLGCAAWFHLAADRGDIPPADRVLLVSPPGPATFTWDVIAGFTPASLDLTRLNLSVATPRLVCSDNDPYCSEDAADVYGKPLGCDVDLLSGAGHLSVPDGYGPWPSVLDWCLDPATRLAPNSPGRLGTE